MKYIELRCIAYIKKDIEYKNMFDLLSKYISYSMSQDEELENLHKKERIFKSYCFGGFYPIEKDKIYKKGKTYTFTLRSLDEKFIDKISKHLRENINNPNLQVIETSKKNIKQFFITELNSITPVIVSLPRQKGEKQRFWSKEDEIFTLQKQLQDNLLKKYKAFYGEDLKPVQNFIQLFDIKNKVPQSIFFTKNERTVRLFGNKFRFIINEDEVSQKLGFVALACGLGEKQSYGGGFAIFNR